MLQFYYEIMFCGKVLANNCIVTESIVIEALLCYDREKDGNNSAEYDVSFILMTELLPRIRPCWIQVPSS